VTFKSLSSSTRRVSVYRGTHSNGLEESVLPPCKWRWAAERVTSHAV